MLSKTSVYEVFMHPFEKTMHKNVVSFWWLCPRPPPGSCPWTLLGDFGPSDPFIAHPWKKSCGRPWLLLLIPSSLVLVLLLL